MRPAVIAALLGGASACSNFLVTPGASADGSSMIAYSMDEETVVGNMKFFARAHVPEGTMEKVWDFDSRVYLGEVPAPRDADGWSYNVVGQTNEHGLTIGETTFGGLPDLATQDGLIDYGTLIYMTLRMAKTAREAIHTMIYLTDTYGYFSTGESFSIADSTEVWVMDLIGKGKGETGAVYVARRIPDGHVSSHANQARITTWDQTDTENNIWAPDAISFARRKGLYAGSDEDFSFADAYDPLTFSSCRFMLGRVWSILRQVAADRDFSDKYFPLVQGKDGVCNTEDRMPFSVPTDRKLTVNDTLWVVRSHYEGTRLEQQSDIGAGPYHSVMRPRPLTWNHKGKQYFNERTVGTQQTGWNVVSQMRPNLPREIASVIWFGADDTSTGPRWPAYASARAAPEAWQGASAFTADFKKAHWVYNVVANFAYSRWNQIGRWVQEGIVRVEEEFARELARSDKALMENMAKHGTESTIDMLTDITVKRGNGMVDTWYKFWGETFVRFHDLGVVEAQAPAHPRDQPLPKCTGVSLDGAWTKRMIAESGDRFKVPSEKLTEHDKRKLTRLRNKL